MKKTDLTKMLKQHKNGSGLLFRLFGNDIDISTINSFYSNQLYGLDYNDELSDDQLFSLAKILFELKVPNIENVNSYCQMFVIILTKVDLKILYSEYDGEDQPLIESIIGRLSIINEYSKKNSIACQAGTKGIALGVLMAAKPEFFNSLNYFSKKIIDYSQTDHPYHKMQLSQKTASKLFSANPSQSIFKLKDDLRDKNSEKRNHFLTLFKSEKKEQYLYYAIEIWKY